MSRIVLGGWIPLSGSPDMIALGEAVHAFLATDRPGRPSDERRDHAAETLARWGVSALDPAHLLTMGERLFGHLEAVYPGLAAIRAEVPVFGRWAVQRLHGRVDLLLRDESRAVVIDHKSYPGAFDTWERKALDSAPQLRLYARAVRAATGCPTVETWVHMPIVGQLIRMESVGGGRAQPESGGFLRSVQELRVEVGGRDQCSRLIQQELEAEAPGRTPGRAGQPREVRP